MKNPNLMIIGYIVLLVVIIVVVKFIISTILNKGADAARNAYVRHKQETDSSKQENLADRFSQVDSSGEDSTND